MVGMRGIGCNCILIDPIFGCLDGWHEGDLPGGRDGGFFQVKSNRFVLADVSSQCSVL